MTQSADQQADAQQAAIASPNPFTFVIKRVVDESPDLSYLGSYSMQDQPGSIERTGWQANREFRYFIPAQTEQDHFDSLREMVNPADSRKRNYGVASARKLARTYVTQDFERMESYGNSWNMTGLIVDLKFQDRVIGTASLWRIESDSDDSYFEEMIADLKTESRADAQLFLNGISSLAQTIPAIEQIDTIERDR